MAETESTLQIPTLIASILDGEDRSILNKAEKRYAVYIRLVQDETNSDVTNMVISQRPFGPLAAQRYLLDKLRTTQMIIESLYGDEILSLVDSWSETDWLDFQKQRPISVKLARNWNSVRYLMLRGWERTAVSAAKARLVQMAREYGNRRDVDRMAESGDDYYCYANFSAPRPSFWSATPNSSPSSSVIPPLSAMLQSHTTVNNASAAITAFSEIARRKDMSGRRTFPVPSDMFQDSDYGDQKKSSHEGYTRADSASGGQQISSGDGCPRSVHVTAEADAKHGNSQLSEDDSYMKFLSDNQKEMVKVLLASTNSNIQQSNERMLRSIMGPSIYGLYVAEKAKKKAAAKKLDTESFLAELPAELRMVAGFYLKSKDLDGPENLLDSSPFPYAARIFKAWKADSMKGVESQPAVVSAARDGSSNIGKSFGSNNVRDSDVNSPSPYQKSEVTKTDAVNCSRGAHVGDSQMNFNRHSDRRQLDSDSHRFGFDADSKRNAYSTLSIKESADAFSNRTLERYQIRNDSSNYASGDSSSYAAVAGKALDADVNRRSSSHYYDYLRNNQNRNANDGDYCQSTDNKNSRDRESSHQFDMNFNNHVIYFGSSHRSWGNQDTVAPFYTSGYNGNNVLRYDPTSYENYQKPTTTTKDSRERERLSRVPSPPPRSSIPSSATAASARLETTTNHRNLEQPTVTNDVKLMERRSLSYQNRGSTASDRLLKTTAEQIRKLDDDFAASKINSKHESFEILDTPEAGFDKKYDFERVRTPSSRYDKNGIPYWNEQSIQSPHNDVIPMDKDHNMAMAPPPGLPARPLTPPISKMSSAIKPTNTASKNAYATGAAPKNQAIFEGSHTSNHTTGHCSSYAAVAGKASVVNRESSSPYYEQFRTNQNGNANRDRYYQSTDCKNSRGSQQHGVNFLKFVHESPSFAEHTCPSWSLNMSRWEKKQRIKRHVDLYGKRGMTRSTRDNSVPEMYFFDMYNNI